MHAHTAPGIWQMACCISTATLPPCPYPISCLHMTNRRVAANYLTQVWEIPIKAKSKSHKLHHGGTDCSISNMFFRSLAGLVCLTADGSLFALAKCV
jgi:hypothetical protein